MVSPSRYSIYTCYDTTIFFQCLQQFRKKGIMNRPLLNERFSGVFTQDFRPEKQGRED